VPTALDVLQEKRRKNSFMFQPGSVPFPGDWPLGTKPGNASGVPVINDASEPIGAQGVVILHAIKNTVVRYRGSWAARCLAADAIQKPTANSIEKQG
jgi:hypothetical protein